MPLINILAYKDGCFKNNFNKNIIFEDWGTPTILNSAGNGWNTANSQPKPVVT